MNSLPSEHWAELSELWFCHTAGNAHMATLARTRIAAQPDLILVGRMDLRVHRSNLHDPQAWRRHHSVQSMLSKMDSHSSSSAAVASAATDGSAADAADASSEDVWSPLPCSGRGCDAILGSVLLTVSATSNPADAVQPASSGECRLLKHMLSNCARKRPSKEEERKTTEADEQPMQTDEQQQQQQQQATSAPSSPSSAFPPSCLCSSYSSSSTPSAHGLSLRCGNVFLPYTLETRLAQELLQRFEASPAARFVVGADEEGENGCIRVRRHITCEQLSNSWGCSCSLPFSFACYFAPVLLSGSLQLLVTQWSHSLSSTLSSAFPFTPLARSSSQLLPVIALEFSVHTKGEEEEGVQKWIKPRLVVPAGSRVPSAAAAAATTLVEPPLSERVSLPLSDLQALASLLQARSHLWPPSARTGSQPGMQRSCLLKLTKHAIADV